MACFCGIFDFGTAHLRERGESVRLSASFAHDVVHANSTNQQCVANERAMTAPRHGFRAHQCDPLPNGQVNDFVEISLEFRRLHVIGVTAKGGISPPNIHRIALGVAQTAKAGHVNVSQAGFL